MRLAKFVKFREEKFGAVLFETRSEKVFTLNPTATAVVREIQAGTPEPEIAARVRAGFEGNGATIDKEVGEFLSELRGKGLIEE
jgi:hypothetical protein